MGQHGYNPRIGAEAGSGAMDVVPGDTGPLQLQSVPRTRPPSRDPRDAWSGRSRKPVLGSEERVYGTDSATGKCSTSRGVPYSPFAERRVVGRIGCTLDSRVAISSKGRRDSSLVPARSCPIKGVHLKVRKSQMMGPTSLYRRLLHRPLTRS